MTLTRERIEEILFYSEDTGVFVWKTRPASTRTEKTWNTRYAEKVAGNLDHHGYLTLYIDRKAYKAHRVAFFLTEGYWPDEVDHKNGIRTDNRACNLRAADDKTNAFNAKVRADNKSGWKGVSWHKGSKKWVSQININGKRKTLGYFADVREAAEEYIFAALEHHGEFARFE